METIKDYTGICVWNHRAKIGTFSKILG